MSTSYERAIEAGFEAMAKFADQPEMQRALRTAMLAMWQSDMLFALRLGNVPKSPLVDPRWYGLPAEQPKKEPGHV